MTPFETFVQEVYAMSKRFVATPLPPNRAGVAANRR